MVMVEGWGGLAYKNTTLWLRTLSEVVEEPHNHAAEQRARLRAAFIKFRERARVLAGEIHQDLPGFTVHDISHLDALWEIATTIAGDDYFLTPTEAFVLGGAFLVHDLGMGLAAYPQGIAGLKSETNWQDTLTVAFHDAYARSPFPEELENPPDDVEKIAVSEMLRSLHAQRAEQLTSVSWSTNGQQYALLEDTDLQRDLGPIIGRIAHSHWWGVEQLREEFDVSIGAPHGCPNEWTIDPLKLACLLRVADAAHLDSRRAPAFLRAVRDPQGVAKEHWVFQGHIHQPQLQADRLVFTSGHKFSVEEASAWWLCFDSLRMVDRELRQVDALLADTKRSRFAARSVANVEEPSRLTRLVPLEGWLPVNATIQVGNVAALVERLGGKELYGQEPTVPLRELVQNSCDAVRARRMIEHRTDDWGDVTVRLGNDSEGHWLEVEDNGIGMSSHVLSQMLLNFGTSYWNSRQMREELPGLLSRGFRSTGKYGIGFFSVFMLGEKVRVTTRRSDAAQNNTLVLEFRMGLESRPILRRAKPDEFIQDGGTRVRIWLTNYPYDPQGLLHRRGENVIWSLSDLCGWLCPAIDSNLFVEENENPPQLVVSAGDWKHIEGEALIRRVSDPDTDDAAAEIELGVEDLARNLRLIKDEEGSIVGRVCIGVSSMALAFLRRGYREHWSGVVTAGGLRSASLTGVPGVLVGEPARAARDIAIPVADPQQLADWASEQAALLSKISAEPEIRSDIAQLVRLFRGADTKELPIAWTADGWVSAADIRSWEHPPDELFLTSLLGVTRFENVNVSLNYNVIAVYPGTPVILDRYNYGPGVHWPDTVDYSKDGEGWEGEYMSKTLEGAVLEALADAWSATIPAILEASEGLVDRGENRQVREIGVLSNNQPIEERVNIVRNPKVL